jgi:aspartyl-tRNA synthetase
MTYDEAMRRFGVDPARRPFGVELVDLTLVLPETPFGWFQSSPWAQWSLPGGATQPRKVFDAWQEFAKQRGWPRLAYVTSSRRDARRPGAKNLVRLRAGRSAGGRSGRRSATAPLRGRTRTRRCPLLGATRLGDRVGLGLMDDSRWELPVGGTDLPDVRADRDGGGTGRAPPVHRPPALSHEDSFAKDPADVPARAYDLILNGTELGGGSIRIHSSEVQKRVFDVIGLTPSRRASSSASCSRRSPTARRRTAASRSASTASRR